MSLTKICSIRQCLGFANGAKASLVRPITTSTNLQVIQNENFFDKNTRLKRPLSPHLTIYKPQVTTMLSITHRGTGVMLSGVMSAFGISVLCLPESFPHYMGVIESMHYGAGLIFLAKLSLAFPLIFHTMNGVRHLTWDLGYGFGLRELYKSGYSVLALSFVLATVVSML